MTRDWMAANQAYLAAAVRDVRDRVRGRSNGERDDTAERLAAAREALAGPAAIDVIAESFGLTPFERSVLLLCAAVELADDGPDARPPTFAHALATLPEAHWSALAPASPLRHWRLIEVLPGDSLVHSPLRIDERILHALTGVHHLDERLAPVLRSVEGTEPRVASHREVAVHIARIWREAACVEVVGADAGASRDIVAAAAAALDRPMWRLRADDIPAGPVDREALLRLWHREVVLGGGVLLIDAHDAGETRSRVHALASELRGRSAIVTREPLGARGGAVRVEVPVPRAAERAALWGEELPAETGRIAAVADQFRLDIDDVRAVTRRMALNEEAGEDALWEAARMQARRRLDDLAQRIEPVATWDDLVLPASQKEILRQIAASASRRGIVYEEWGFADGGARGLGISVLFAGASGTGKTMAAEVLARELRLDIYRIDLSQVVSKYIGETEKNLGRVFDAAEQGGAVLLFDEADALFGRRSEVKDSHDRYANIEVSYLLQRMESYRGLAILTTNAKSSLDPAFLRRLRYVVQFPFPDAPARAEIWRRVFPAGVPREGLDAARLARLDVTGGNIRNIAVNAAFLAAADEAPVRMTHVLRAARAEYVKLEKPLTGAEVAGWT